MTAQSGPMTFFSPLANLTLGTKVCQQRCQAKGPLRGDVLLTHVLVAPCASEIIHDALMSLRRSAIAVIVILVVLQQRRPWLLDRVAGYEPYDDALPPVAKTAV